VNLYIIFFSPQNKLKQIFSDIRENDDKRLTLVGLLQSFRKKGLCRTPTGTINTNSNPTGLPSGSNESELESDKTQYLTISRRSCGFSRPEY